VAVDVSFHSVEQILKIAEDSPAEPVLGKVAKEALDYIQPTCACWRKVNVKNGGVLMFKISGCHFLLVDPGVEQGVVVDDGVGDEAGAIVSYLLFGRRFSHGTYRS